VVKDEGKGDSGNRPKDNGCHQQIGEFSKGGKGVMAEEVEEVLIIDWMPGKLEYFVACFNQGDKKDQLQGVNHVIDHLDEDLVQPEGQRCSQAKHAGGANNREKPQDNTNSNSHGELFRAGSLVQQHVQLTKGAMEMVAEFQLQ